MPATRLASALLEEIPQIIIFVLSFTLVANIWWFHHKIVAQLAEIDVVMITLNFVMLGLVALIPFPTSLVGSARSESAAAVPFVAVFLGISVTCLLMVLWAQRVGAWHRRPKSELYRWLVIGWSGYIVGLVLTTLVALWLPIVALVMAALLGVMTGVALGVFGPPAYREWEERPGL